MWSYNYLRMFAPFSDKFRFRHEIQIELEGMKQGLDDKVGKILDDYLDKICRENPDRSF